MSQLPIEVMELPEEVDYVVTADGVSFNRSRPLSAKARMLPEVRSLWARAIEQDTGFYSENGDHIYEIEEVEDALM